MTLPNQTQNDAVVLENVSCGYDEDSIVLKNVSLTVPCGKTVVIMGGSGSGKSTLLNIISGHLKPSSGTVTVLGHNIKNLSNKALLNLRKRLGFLFQLGALFTDSNVFDNVAFSLKEHTKLSKNMIRTIVAMKLQAVGLFGVQDMMPAELSGGMERRVSLARATTMDPELMLYDEPFTGLDPISVNVILMLIKQLSLSLKQSVVLVSHDVKTSFELADYIYFMANGSIVAHGEPENLKNCDNKLVQQFLLGEIDGPFNVKYQSDVDYNKYLGL